MRVSAGLKIGQGLFTVLAFGLLFEKEDRQRAKEGQVAGGVSLPDGATVLILSAITTMVLAIFNTPVVPGGLQQRLRACFIRPESGDAESRLVGFLGHLAFAHMLDVAVDANHLSHAR